MTVYQTWPVRNIRSPTIVYRIVSAPKTGVRARKSMMTVPLRRIPTTHPTNIMKGLKNPSMPVTQVMTK